MNEIFNESFSPMNKEQITSNDPVQSESVDRPLADASVIQMTK